MEIDDRLGSIETGKEVDIVLFDGEPLEYLTHVTHVFVKGRLVFERED
jgi:imidazolonepropionase-like amidohydrolase